MNFVFTGPECSGKTTLASAVALKYGFGLSREVAREYLQQLMQPYTSDDLKNIAVLQHKEQSDTGTNHTHLCSDTDLLTIIIWYEEKYGTCPSSIKDYWQPDGDTIFILCSPDFAWEFDPQRENPEDRNRLFEIYEGYLMDRGLEYIICSGLHTERVKTMDALIQRKIKH